MGRDWVEERENRKDAMFKAHDDMGRGQYLPTNENQKEVLKETNRWIQMRPDGRIGKNHE